MLDEPAPDGHPGRDDQRPAAAARADRRDRPAHSYRRRPWPALRAAIAEGEGQLGRLAAIESASEQVCYALGIPAEWASRCEDSAHVGHDGTHDSLAQRLDLLLHDQKLGDFEDKVSQLGSYGGGNAKSCTSATTTAHAAADALDRFIAHSLANENAIHKLAVLWRQIICLA